MYSTDVTFDFIKRYYLASARSERIGRYYISPLTAVVNSYDKPDLEWDSKNGEFSTAPEPYKMIHRLSIKHNDYLPSLAGLEILLLCVINKALGCEKLKHKSKVDLVNHYMSVPCLKNKYEMNLDSLPECVFDKGKKEEFISLCHESFFLSASKRIKGTARKS
jgi:hypothetical protein